MERDEGGDEGGEADIGILFVVVVVDVGDNDAAALIDGARCLLRGERGGEVGGEVGGEKTIALLLWYMRSNSSRSRRTFGRYMSRRELILALGILISNAFCWCVKRVNNK